MAASVLCGSCRATRWRVISEAPHMEKENSNSDGSDVKA